MGAAGDVSKLIGGAVFTPETGGAAAISKTEVFETAQTEHRAAKPEQLSIAEIYSLAGLIRSCIFLPVAVNEAIDC